jgi:iron complex outermembrane recepter protein
MKGEMNPCKAFRPHAIAFAIAAAQLFAAHAALAQSNQSQQEYHLHRAPLDQTLLQIAKQSGVLISYDPVLVKSLQSAPIDGKFTPTEAIKHALEGTGLELVATASGQLTLKRTPVTPTQTQTPTKKSSAESPTAQSAPMAEAVLPLISVAAQRDSGGTGFVADSSSTYARSDTPLSETPKSVSVINAAVIQSQSDTTVSDIVRNASGVVTRPGAFGVPTFAVRGFDQTPVMTDGLVTPSDSAASSLTPAIAISSVEVIKGPSAIMAGDAPPGGVVNVVKKMPQADPFNEIQTGLGMYGYEQLAFDSTGAITDDKKLRYRFTVSGDQTGETPMGADGGHNFYFAPTVEWKDSTTDFILGYTRAVTRQPFPQYTIGFENGGYPQSYFRYPLGNPSDGFFVKADTVEAKLEQKLGDNVTFVSHSSYSRSDQHQSGWAAVTTIDDTDSATFLGVDAQQVYYTLNSQNYFRIKADLGQLKTTTLVGVDYTRFRYSTFDSQTLNLITNPDVFVQQPYPVISDDLPYSGSGETTQIGSYIQEQVNYGRLHALGSLRYDNYLNDYTIVGGALYAGSHETAASPSLGVMYQITSEMAAYASYNRGFIPSIGLSFTGKILPAERSDQLETGLKFNLLDDKLFVTTSLYRITYSNQNVADPVHPGFFIGTSGAVSRGAEIEVQGQVLPSLNVTAHYSYNDYQQAFDPALKVNLPKHTASLWATYNFQMPELQGFGVGLGLFYASSQDVGNTGLYHLPSQVETDLGLFYRKKHYGLNLSVKNLFNRNLYSSSTSETFIPMGPSRMVMLTGTYDF